MGVESESNGHAMTPEIARGRGLSGLDLSDPLDMELLHKALARWPRRFRKIDTALRDQMVKEAQVMLDNATLCQDAELAEKMRVAALRVLVQMDRLNSIDEGRILNAMLPKNREPNVQVNIDNRTYAATFK